MFLKSKKLKLKLKLDKIIEIQIKIGQNNWERKLQEKLEKESFHTLIKKIKHRPQG